MRRSQSSSSSGGGNDGGGDNGLEGTLQGVEGVGMM